MENKINCPSQTTSEAPKEVFENDGKHRHNTTRKNRRSKKKRPYCVWADEEDDLLRKVYPHLPPRELQKLFQKRTPDAVDMRASHLGIKKTIEYISDQNSENSSKLGIAHLTDRPLEALAEKYPEMKQVYDTILAQLMMHPGIDPDNILTVDLLKEAVLYKATQCILMHDRIMDDLKGKQLIINPRTGLETWVEARYPHSPDIANDAKMARHILFDLGIIKEPEKKVELLGNLRLLWERDGKENMSP